MTTKISVQNIETATLASITPPRITSIGYGGDETATDTAGNVSVTLTGEGFAAGASVFIDGTSAGSVSVVSSTQITFIPPAKTAGTYPLYVINSDGSSAIAIPGISYSGLPTYTTAAGNLANVYETTSFNSAIVATGDAPIAYSVYSGTLPPGANLSSTGNITGTSSSTASPTTYNFTVRASDAQNQDTDRPFSITVNPDIVIWGSPAADAIIELAADAAMSNVSFIANSAAGYSVSYSANILPTGLSLIGSNVFGTPTVTGNTISVVTATSATTNRTANRTFTWVVSVAGDLYFKNTVLLLNGETTTPTWLSDASTNNLLVTNRSDFRTNAAVIPTGRSPYNKTTYPAVGSAWFAGNAPDGPGAYDTLSFQMPQLGTVFTVEFWFYADETSPGLTDTKYFIYSNSGFNIGIYNDRGLAAGTTGFQFQTATGAFSVRTWNHVAVVRTGTGAGEFKMYLNGTLITLASGAFTSATTPLTAAEAKIGGQPNGYQNLFRGNIADFRIVNGTAVYTDNFTAPAAPLTAISNTVFLALQYKQGTTNSGFVDDSTNGFPIIRYGNSAQGTFSPFSPTGYSAYFDGSGDYLTTSGFGLPTNFTLEFWSYLTAQPSGGHFTSASSMGPIISLDTLKTILGQNGGYFLNPPNDSAVYPNGVSPLNQWNHWAVVRSSGTITFYLNGIKLGSAANSTDYTASQTFGIGAANDGGPVNVPHYMSNFRFSSVARYSGTSTTVANFALPTANFTSDADTIFLGLASNRFKDSGPNNRAITVAGDSKIVAFSPFAPAAAYSAATHGGSMYFDGTGDYLTGPANNADVLLGTGDFTFEGWFYQTATNTYPGVLEIGVHTVNGILFIASNGSTITAYGPAGFMGTATAPPLNTWNHIAWVRSSGTFKIYVNGVGNAGTASASNFSDNTTTTFGGESTRSNATYTYSGYMSGVRLVKGTAVYTANFTPPSTPLTAISGTSLLIQGTNAGIFDRTGRNVIETRGYTTAEPGRRQPEIRTQVKKYGSSSIFFGGNNDALFVRTNPALAFESGNFTVEFWVNFTSIANRQDLVWWVPDNDSLRGGISWRLSGDALCYYDAAVGGAINTAWLPTINTWYHIALSRSGSSTRLFIDGVAGTTYSTILPYAASYRLFIGKDSDSDSYPFTGYMDDFRITKGVARYTTTFTPPTTFLLK
jgi:hypothetical protein